MKDNFTLSTGGSGLAAWTTTDPYYAGTGFNATTGIYTVPASGKYVIKVNINYSTTAAVTVALGATSEPSFVVQRISPTSTVLLRGNFAVLNVNILLVLSLKAILGAGQIALLGDVNLSAGDQIQVVYNPDSMTGVTLNFGGTVNPPGVTWSMHAM